MRAFYQRNTYRTLVSYQGDFVSGRDDIRFTVDAVLFGKPAQMTWDHGALTGDREAADFVKLTAKALKGP